MQKETEKKVEQMISHMMLDMGVPAHLKGYRYVRSAVLMAEEDMKVVGSVTKLLYPQTAFPLHQDYVLHGIHQMHCNTKSGLQI